MTTNLLRVKPDPIPAIHPVPEYLASGALREVYEETKALLQVPWMGVVTMAFAHHPRFYAALMEWLRGLARSGEFLSACAALRATAEEGVGGLGGADLPAALQEAGYAARELEEIRAQIEIFSHGNMPYLLIATTARLLLEGKELSRERAIAPASTAKRDAQPRPLVLMEAHHADAPTRAVYEDIKRRLGLPFVNTDYRALARWPSFFALAWQDLKSTLGSPAYDALVEKVHETAVSLVLSLPNPAGLESATLVAAAEEDASSHEVAEVVRLFQWLLPGLVVNVACIRQRTGAGIAAG